MNETSAPAPERLSRLNIKTGGTDTITKVNRRYSLFIKSLRYILPLIALVMTVIAITWNDGTRMEPIKKEELIPQSENIQNELLKPVYNAVDSKNQPYSVTADRAIQNRTDPDLIELSNPVANLEQNDGSKLDGKAQSGLYQQKEQKLNLQGGVSLNHSNGYTLETEELRIDLQTNKAYSGKNVEITGPAGSINATGLEGDTQTGTLIFNGPAKVILYSDGNFLSPQEKTK